MNILWSAAELPGTGPLEVQTVTHIQQIGVKKEYKANGAIVLSQERLSFGLETIWVNIGSFRGNTSTWQMWYNCCKRYRTLNFKVVGNTWTPFIWCLFCWGQPTANLMNIMGKLSCFGGEWSIDLLGRQHLGHYSILHPVNINAKSDTSVIQHLCCSLRIESRTTPSNAP